MKEKCWIIIILILISGFFFIRPPEEEDDDDLQLRRYKDLGIVSAKKPFNTHLWWEHATYGLIMVDSTNQTVLLISTDKGENWSIIDLSDNTNSYKIQSGWLDGNDLWLVMCDNDGTADNFEVFFIELDDSNDCNPVAVSAGADINTVYAWDIFKMAGDFYVHSREERTGTENEVIWDVDTNPFVEKATEDNDGQSIIIAGKGFVNNDTDVYYAVVQLYDPIGDDNYIYPITYKVADPNVIGNNPQIIAYTLPSNESLLGIAFDGSVFYYYIGNKEADGLNYLIQQEEGEALTVLARYDVALQLDRNNAGTVPNELEKGFGISDEIVYEIKAKRGGITLLQDLSDLSDANIIAITDNFLMNDDGDMFEFTDVVNEISFMLYNAGIMGIRKKGSFITHPDFQNRWSQEDSIKFYDQYDQLEFWGKITKKSRNNRGLFVIKFRSFTNEMFTKTYEKDYSGDDLDTKQKDLIDNACDFNYRSSSIVGTTQTFDYEYNRALIYMFWFGRRFERQVPYIEPDGKIWTKLYSALSPNDMIYPGIYNFKNETVGATGTDIDFIDETEDATAVIIISELDGHRKVLRQTDVSGNNFSYHYMDTQAMDGWLEFWVRVNDVTADNRVSVNEGGTVIVMVRIEASKFQYLNDAVGWTDIGLAAVNDTWYHILIEWTNAVNDTFDLYIDGTIYEDDTQCPNNQTSGVDRFFMQQRTAATDYIYIDAVGYYSNASYNKGDNEVAWDLNNHWQNSRFVDIPGIEEVNQGFFEGNTGITRNTVRYRNNETTIRPVAATRDPIEQLKGILSLEEFRDPKIEESTEADQLGDNRYAMWSKDTIYVGLEIEGIGYLQPGKTVHIENTGQITIAESNLVVLSFRRDPKNDVYRQLILSDNIIFPSEFNDLDNTSPQQIHTATVQAIVNQFDINLHLTREGGIVVELTNKTGAASVKGTIIEAHGATDNAFRVCDANSVETFGIVYEDGIADGSECLVCIGGRCQVLLKNATLSTRGNWVGVSDVAGRADATGASPPAQPEHFKEVGHCIESKGADTDVLAFIIHHNN